MMEIIEHLFDSVNRVMAQAEKEANGKAFSLCYHSQVSFYLMLVTSFLCLLRHSEESFQLIPFAVIPRNPSSIFLLRHSEERG